MIPMGKGEKGGATMEGGRVLHKNIRRNINLFLKKY